MIKKLYDKCIKWAGYKYAKQILAIEAFIESSFFPIPPDVMIIPMVVAKRNEFIQIALVATIFSVLGALFGYYIGYSLNELAIKIFEFYGYESSYSLKEKFSAGSGLAAWLGILIGWEKPIFKLGAQPFLLAELFKILLLLFLLPNLLKIKKLIKIT